VYEFINYSNTASRSFAFLLVLNVEAGKTNSSQQDQVKPGDAPRTGLDKKK